MLSLLVLSSCLFFHSLLTSALPQQCVSCPDPNPDCGDIGCSATESCIIFVGDGCSTCPYADCIPTSQVPPDPSEPSSFSELVCPTDSSSSSSSSTFGNSSASSSTGSYGAPPPSYPKIYPYCTRTIISLPSSDNLTIASFIAARPLVETENGTIITSNDSLGYFAPDGFAAINRCITQELETLLCCDALVSDDPDTGGIVTGHVNATIVAGGGEGGGDGTIGDGGSDDEEETGGDSEEPEGCDLETGEGCEKPQLSGTIIKSSNAKTVGEVKAKAGAVGAADGGDPVRVGNAVVTADISTPPGISCKIADYGIEGGSPRRRVRRHAWHHVRH